MEPVRDPERLEVTHLFQLGHLDQARVLEIGCGSGRLTWLYAKKPASIAGLDLDRERLALAVADRSAELAGKVAFLQATAESLPFASESFDVAIFAWSL